MRYRYQMKDAVYDIVVEQHAGSDVAGYLAYFEDQAYHFEILDVQPGKLSLRFEGRPITLFWAAEGNQKWISREGCTYLLEPPSRKRTSQNDEKQSEGKVRSPMPAQVRTIATFEGDIVAKGDTLLLLEAMKMEIRIQAPRAGRIARIFVTTGQAVERDQFLVEIVEP